MANYTFIENQVDPLNLWSKIQSGLSNDVIIKSIQDKKHYTVIEVTPTKLTFTTESRNGGEPEFITKEDFLKIIPKLKEMHVFNTSISKPIFRESKIYKKRSPMFALLLSSGVIKKI